MGSFTGSDEWLAAFGELLLLQKPEAMELFPPDFPEGWFSYLMLFSDGVKIDLTLVPVADIEHYFAQDPLIRVLLDKDNICPELPPSSDEPFWIQEPSAAFVNDCANEFSFACTYAAKGLLRDELLFASWIFEQVMRTELLRMLGYLAGARNGFPLNTGKHDKFLPRLLSAPERDALSVTYRLDSVDAAWEALYTAMALFEEAMAEVCVRLAYPCPDYVTRIRPYIEKMKMLK